MDMDELELAIRSIEDERRRLELELETAAAAAIGSSEESLTILKTDLVPKCPDIFRRESDDQAAPTTDCANRRQEERSGNPGRPDVTPTSLRAAGAAASVHLRQRNSCAHLSHAA
jgi:hypothetical protein